MDPTNQILRIDGMTCENCANHVKGALLSIAGVRDAKVDRSSDSATIITERDIPRDLIASTLEEEGYTLQ